LFDFGLFLPDNDIMGSVHSKRQLCELALSLGASAFGVCEIGELVEKIHPEIRDKARTLPYAISIGIELQKAVMETLTDRPNEIYKSHYRAVNIRLDDITLSLAQRISEMGRKAIPIPASKVIKRYPMIGHLNHREFAYKSGLGWRGKNNLLIHPVFGGRFRLSTLLTDLELKPDEVLDLDCGECRACARHCPADAIGDSPEEFDLEKCRDQVTFFSRDGNFGHLICGLCLDCCPGKKDVEK
jgi:epoxyqueuosine reductase QueG